MTPIFTFPVSCRIVSESIVVFPEPGEEIIFRQRTFFSLKNAELRSAHSSFLSSIFLFSETFNSVILEFNFFEQERRVFADNEFGTFAGRTDGGVYIKIMGFATFFARGLEWNVDYI